MNKTPVIVCLCGSTRFKDKFLEWNKRFTLEGCIVIMPGVFAHSGDEITDEQKIQLDQLHKRKIAMADLVFIIDQDGYIGDSTREEIGFAKALGTEIIYMSNVEKEEKERLLS